MERKLLHIRGSTKTVLFFFHFLQPPCSLFTSYKPRVAHLSLTPRVAAIQAGLPSLCQIILSLKVYTAGTFSILNAAAVQAALRREFKVQVQPLSHSDSEAHRRSNSGTRRSSHFSEKHWNWTHSLTSAVWKQLAQLQPVNMEAEWNQTLTRLWAVTAPPSPSPAASRRSSCARLSLPKVADCQQLSSSCALQRGW